MDTSWGRRNPSRHLASCIESDARNTGEGSASEQTKRRRKGGEDVQGECAGIGEVYIEVLQLGVYEKGCRQGGNATSRSELKFWSRESRWCGWYETGRGHRRENEGFLCATGARGGRGGVAECGKGRRQLMSSCSPVRGIEGRQAPHCFSTISSLSDYRGIYGRPLAVSLF